MGTLQAATLTADNADLPTLFGPGVQEASV